MEFPSNKTKKKQTATFSYINLWLLALIQLLFSPTTQAAISHDQSLSWQTLNSKHFELHYHNDEFVLAEKALNIAEQVLIDLQPMLNWIPKEKIEIILSDELDTNAGFVDAPFLPSLRITLYPTVPDSIFSFSEIDDWLESLITHELTHALHIDKVAGKPFSLRNIFGRHPLSFPNLLQPAWLLEGLATYMETNVARGIGRGQDDIFNMMMRMEVKKGIKSYEEVSINSAIWPVGVTRYLYGVHFFQFLEHQYSRDSIKRFIESYSDNIIPFSLNSNSILIYGKSMPELWEGFSEYLYKKYLPQLSIISTADMKSGIQLTNNGYYKNFVQPLENNTLIYSQYDGRFRPALYLGKPEINKTEKILEIRKEARLNYNPKSGLLVSQIETYRNTNYFYDLFNVDIENKNISRLTRGERYRRGVWSPNGKKIIAVHNKLGKHTLALLNDNGRLIDLIWEGNEGEFIAEFDWSPDSNSLIASVKRHSGSWNLEEFSLINRSWKPLVTSDKNEIQPKYSIDGKNIIYSANYNGVYNIYEYHKETGEVDLISNVDGGAFMPIPDNDDQIYYIGYTENGYDIFLLEDKNPMVTNIEINQEIVKPKPVYSEVSFEKTDYSSLLHLKPTWWSPPFFMFSDKLSLIGTYFTGADALNIHTYDTSIAYDIAANAISAELNYTYDRWFPVLQTHLSTVTRENKNVDIMHFEFLAPLLQREKSWYFGTTFRNENERFSNDSSLLNANDYLIGIGTIYDTRKRSILSNSLSDGRLFTFTAETSELFGSDFNGKMFIAKWNEYILLKPEQVLSIRVVTGLGLEFPRKFQLGGYSAEGNYFSVNPFSTTPFRTTLYNTRNYALRGYNSSSDALKGRRMMMYNVEWRFPIKRIEKNASTLPIGIHQISGAAFIESGAAWDGGIEPNDFHSSVGGEIRFQMNLFYYVPVTVRSGYAYGLDEGGGHQFYLSLGSSYRGL